MRHDTLHTPAKGGWGVRLLKLCLTLFAGLAAFVVIGDWVGQLERIANERSEWPTATPECLVGGTKSVSEDELVRLAQALNLHSGPHAGEHSHASSVYWTTPQEVREARKDPEYEYSRYSTRRHEHAARLGLKRWATVVLSYEIEGAPSRERDWYDACGTHFAG